MNILQRLFGIKKYNKDKYDGFDIEELPHAGRYFPRYKGQYMFFWFTSQHYELQSNISGAVYHNTKEEAKRTIDRYIELQGVGTNIIPCVPSSEREKLHGGNDAVKNNLYSEIEQLIIRWNLDGTKTAGSLTREIMELIKSYE